MAGDPLKRLQSGDDLPPHQTFNCYADAAIAEKARQHKQARQAVPDFRQTSIVLVRNDSGATVARNGVLGISGVIITHTNHANEFLHRVTLTGVDPVLATHQGKFVVLLEPLGDGKIGKGVVSGVVQVKIDIHDTGHMFADIQDDTTANLESRAVGSARILYIEPPVGTLPATGVHWCVVDLGVEDPQRPFGVTVAKDGGVAGSPVVGTAAAVDCTWTYSVYDLAGFQVGSEITPERSRFPGTIYGEAGAGGRSAEAIARWDTGSAPLGTDPGWAGELLLFDVDEFPSADTCEE